GGGAGGARRAPPPATRSYPSCCRGEATAAADEEAEPLAGVFVSATCRVEPDDLASSGRVSARAFGSPSGCVFLSTQGARLSVSTSAPSSRPTRPSSYDGRTKQA